MEGTFCGAKETCVTLIYTLGVDWLGGSSGSWGWGSVKREECVARAVDLVMVIEHIHNADKNLSSPWMP